MGQQKLVLIFTGALLATIIGAFLAARTVSVPPRLATATSNSAPVTTGTATNASVAATSTDTPTGSSTSSSGNQTANTPTPTKAPTTTTAPTATTSSTPQPTGQIIDIRGTIYSVNRTNRSFVLTTNNGNVQVDTNGNTRFEDNATFNSLTPGVLVTVTGQYLTNGDFLASVVNRGN